MPIKNQGSAPQGKREKRAEAAVSEGLKAMTKDINAEPARDQACGEKHPGK